MIVQIFQLGAAWQVTTPFGVRVVVGDLPETLSTLSHLVLSRCPVVEGGTKIEIRTNSQQLVDHVASINSKLRPSDPYPVDGDLVNNTLFWVAARAGVTFSGVLQMAKTQPSKKSPAKPAAKPAAKAPAKPAAKPPATKAPAKPAAAVAKTVAKSPGKPPVKPPPNQKAPPKKDSGNLLECDILGVIQAKYEIVEGFGIRVHDISLTPGIASLVAQLISVELSQLGNEGLTTQDDSAEEAASGAVDDGNPEFLDEDDDNALPPDDDEENEPDETTDADEEGTVDLDDESEEENDGLAEDEEPVDGDEGLLDDEDDDAPLDDDEDPIMVGDDEEGQEEADPDEIEDDDAPIEEDELDADKVTTPTPKDKSKLPKLTPAQEKTLAKFLENTSGKISSYSAKELRAAGIKYLGEATMKELQGKVTQRDLMDKILDAVSAAKRKQLLAEGAGA